jgi:single-stranded-DNA-specific exonuclease
MPNLTKRWLVAPRLPDEIDKALHGYPPILRQILYNRGYASLEEAKGFLMAERPLGTDPTGLRGVPKAVDRIIHALKHDEYIAIYGDYDADGVTATALMVQIFKALGANVMPYIPNRFEEGYGLNREALDSLAKNDVDLVITVDCGMRSIPEAEHARNLGMDLIITDHHHPGEALPISSAIINPKQPHDTYPEKELAGVGLAYKLVTALIEQLKPGSNYADDTLDLVALGTVADLAPLTGENRWLVRQGLELLRRPKRQGIMALIGASGLTPHRITSTHIGFVLGPRLNAAGRLDSALAAMELLVTADVHRAGKLAQQLEMQNKERQQLTRTIQAQAEELALEKDPEVMLLFAAHPDFNPGVVGLAASRLTDLYYRPAIVAYKGDEYTRGSCRSISEFHITEALDRCEDLLVHHGGHAAAAGFTVRNEYLPELVERLQIIAREQLSEIDLRPTLTADIEIPLSALKPELLEHLGWLQPTGYGNRKAYFVSRELKVVRSRSVGRDGGHLKLTVTDGRLTFDAIAFRLGHWQGNIPRSVDLIYNFELNEYNGRQTLQLNVRDIKPSQLI